MRSNCGNVAISASEALTKGTWTEASPCAPRASTALDIVFMSIPRFKGFRFEVLRGKNGPHGGRSCASGGHKQPKDRFSPFARSQ